MKKTIFLTAAAVITTLGAFAQQPLNASEGENWLLRGNRSDEFNASRENNAPDYTKWNPNPENFQTWTWNNERNIKEFDGTVKLTMRREQTTRNVFQPCARRNESTTLDYTSGFLKSFNQGIYGYYEARIKGANRFPGVAPAFWVYSPINDNLTTPGSIRYAEIDFVEMQQRPNNVRHMDHNLHRILTADNGQAGPAGRRFIRPLTTEATRRDQANDYTAPFDPRQDFHIYGCKVTRQEIIWYVDRVEVGRKPNLTWTIPMNVALSMGLRAPFATFECNGLAADSDATTSVDFPTTMEVDYVRVWELGDNSTPTPTPAPEPTPVAGDNDNDNGGNNNGGNNNNNNNGGNNNNNNGGNNNNNNGGATVKVKNTGNRININCNNLTLWRKSDNHAINDRVHLSNVAYRLIRGTGRCRPGADVACSTRQWARVGACRVRSSKGADFVSEISVFPNPTSDEITVAYSGDDAAITIANLQGQVLLSKESATGSETIDVTGLTNGIYIVSVTSNGSKSVEKLVIK